MRATIHLAMMSVPFSRGMAREKWQPVTTFRKRTIFLVRRSNEEQRLEKPLLLILL
ncbi:hypothetical protein KSC_027360 [Ktedonobacter sp. SOSP1-52]|uniref:hypothetical protein n=1 Tax=Ktedonobacter sp. SOSP1-52 TaxID=2778366 RepID=UPI001916AADE|nr:hypothetical protein [Ktedonobacter sp. SOSP1-52]GHO63844.1 hypothetical protein KSC_027360 [Ktedonobacter sp. SOSP1-52]